MLRYRWTRPGSFALALAAGLLAWSPLARSEGVEPTEESAWVPPAAQRAAGSVEAAPKREIEVVWRDVLGLTRAESALVAQEVHDALSMVGVTVRWKETNGTTVASAAIRPQVQVVLLAADRTRDRKGNVLGAADPNASAVWVYFPSVCHTLGLEPARRVQWSLFDGRDLARAMGRVVAHEIAHVLAPRVPHAAFGLMAPQLNRSFLLGSSLTWDPVSARALAEGATTGEETVAAIADLAAEG